MVPHQNMAELYMIIVELYTKTVKRYTTTVILLERIAQLYLSIVKLCTRDYIQRIIITCNDIQQP